MSALGVALPVRETGGDVLHRSFHRRVRPPSLDEGAKHDFGHLRVVGVGREPGAFTFPPEFEASNTDRPIALADGTTREELRGVAQCVADCRAEDCSCNTRSNGWAHRRDLPRWPSPELARSASTAKSQT